MHWATERPDLHTLKHTCVCMKYWCCCTPPKNIQVHFIFISTLKSRPEDLRIILGSNFIDSAFVVAVVFSRSPAELREDKNTKTSFHFGFWPKFTNWSMKPLCQSGIFLNSFRMPVSLIFLFLFVVIVGRLCFDLETKRQIIVIVV